MKEQIYAKAYEILRKRKEKAERDADAKVEYLNTLPDFYENEKNINIITSKCGIAQAKKENCDKETAEKARLLEIRKKLLLKYGFSEKDLQPAYFCPKCSDTGFYGKTECQCLKNILTELLVEDSQVFFASSLESVDSKNQKAYYFAKEFCDKYPNVARKNIILSGKTGTGKTYLASAIARSLMEKQIPVLFLTANSLSKKLLDIFLSKENSDILEDILTQQDVLVIDDLGSEPMRKNVTVEYLLSLLNDRALSGKTTIITTNLDFKDLQNRYGERFMSKLADDKNYYRIEMTDSDKRFKMK
ncbi:MAG TPA: ATP-binding protein [Clostridia bacterium]|nr:ATP-binding protein [Clostridia bacterium]